MLGDPNNWYNDVTPGWTGQGGGYLTAVHEVQAYANMPLVRFRIWFGSDSSIVANGFAFDDFEIFDNLPQLNVDDASPPGALASIPPGAPDVLMQTLRLDASGNISSNVDAITVTRNGTLMDADIVAVKLWLDNGNAVFEPLGDTMIGMGTFSAGVSTFAGLGAVLDLAPLQPEWVHISYSLAVTATPAAPLATASTAPPTSCPWSPSRSSCPPNR